jgi:hypothetical protein
MKKSILVLVGAEIALIATAILFLAFEDLWNTFVGVTCVVLALALVGWLVSEPRHLFEGGRAVGVGTVREISNGESVTATGEQQVFIEVVSVSGETFVGRLAHGDGDTDTSLLRPGLVVLVAFDPAAREELSLPDDVVAVRARRV